MKCKHCGAEFTPRRQWQRFCSVTCRQAAYRVAHRAELNERNRQWNAAHKDRYKKYYAEHRDEIKIRRMKQSLRR